MNLETTNLFIVELMKTLLTKKNYEKKVTRKLSLVENEIYMSSVVSHFNKVIQESFDYLNNSYYQSDLTSNCTFYRACEFVIDATEYGEYSEIGYSTDFQFGNLSTNRDIIMFKRSIHSDYNLTKEKEDICVINEQVTLWESHLEKNENGLIWQYIGTPEDTLGSFPAYNWTSSNQCPGTYQPTLRPWYVSGSSGQKNMVILLDISDSAPDSDGRVEISKEIAKLFLGTLSFRDFVTIIPYSDFAMPYDENFLTRGDIENVVVLETYVDGITVNSGSSTNIGLALQTAYDILKSSDESGDTSGCTNTIVLLTNGENEIKTVDPLTVVEDSGIDAMIFSFIISPDDENPARLVPTQLACSTDGLVEVYTGTEFDYTNPVELFGTYLSSGIENTQVRWSEPYIDAFGLGKIITGSRPVYSTDENGISTLRSIIATDILFSNISNNGIISEDDVIAHLVANQVCEPFIVNQEVRSSLQEANICDNLGTDESTSEEEYVELEALWITMSVLLFLFMSCFPCIAVAHNKKEDEDNEHCVCAISLFSVFFWLWFLCMFWSYMWDDIQQYHEWKATDATVERKELNGYRCCDIVNCQCSNVNAPSCSSLKSQLIEGVCDNGYHCCNEVCYSCNCYETCSPNGNRGGQTCTTHCSTCCDCVQSVSHRKCESVCGTCYKPTVYVSYLIDNNDDGKESLIHTSFSKSCGRDQLSCANSYLDDYPDIGETLDIYYNPSNPTQITESVSYDDGVLAATIIPAGIIFMLFCFSMLIACPEHWKITSLCTCICTGCSALFSKKETEDTKNKVNKKKGVVQNNKHDTYSLPNQYYVKVKNYYEEETI